MVALAIADMLALLVAATWAVFLWREHVSPHPVSRMSKPELVNALFSEDKELANDAAIALVHGRHREAVVAGPQTRAVKIGSEGSKDIVLILQEARPDPDSHFYKVVLLDQNGTILDRVLAPLSRVSSDVCDVVDPPEQDGAQLIIRTSVPKGWEGAPNIPYVSDFSGRTHEGEVPRADYERLGHCRIAVQEHKFKAVFPKMEPPRPSKID
jgi:hypothetical protein